MVGETLVPRHSLTFFYLKAHAYSSIHFSRFSILLDLMGELKYNFFFYLCIKIDHGKYYMDF